MLNKEQRSEEEETVLLPLHRDNSSK